MGSYLGQQAVSTYFASIDRKIDYSDSASIGNIFYSFGKDVAGGCRETERYLRVTLGLSLTSEQIDALAEAVVSAMR
jgi:hypothetical protein